jgi:DNA-binding IclR family transcriptional regulator
VTTLAAPVFDADGAVRYVLQCPGLEADVPSRKHDVAAPLLQAAERIGIMLRNAAA